ncbi:glucosaminidase domain-containing protein [Sulfurimonas sp.]
MKLIGFLFISLFLFGCNEDNKSIKKERKKVAVPKSISVVVKKKMSIQEKKKKFIALLLPAIRKVNNELMQRYKRVASDIKNKKYTKEIQALKIKYNAKNDDDLLAKLKPHPISITLAQAAMESSWGTSRFFKEANNVFGMWSVNENEPRIAAGEKRGGKKTIWLRKFNTIEDAVRAYYEMLAEGKAYDEFRRLRLKYNDSYKITAGLDKYSEMKAAYTKVLNQVIRHNNFNQYNNDR